MTRRTWWVGAVLILGLAVLAWWLAPRLFPSADEEAPLQLGAVLPLSGTSAQIGIWQRKGLDLAIAEANARGGIGGAPLAVVYEDSQGDPKAGLAGLQRIFATARPSAVFLSLSGVSNAALPVLAERQTAGLLLAVSLPEITRRSDWAFRFNLGSEDEARAMAAYLAGTPFKRVAVAAINDEFGVGALAAFREATAPARITIIAAESYDKEATDFRTLIAKLGETRPDAIYVIGYVRSSVLLIKQMRELGVTAQVLGNMALSVPSFLELGGEALSGALFTVTAFDPESPRPLTRDFVTAYRDRYAGETPTFFAAFAYDAAGMSAEALRRQGTAAGQVRAGLAATSGWQGVMGTLTVRPDRTIEFPIRVVQNRGGKLVEAAGGTGR